MKRKYFFSIIVPAYNTRDFIEECLLSVSNQEYSNYEVIVVDDASTDDTKSVIKDYIEKNERIKLISQNANRGLLEARYSGCLEAKGDYVLFLDSDDYFVADIFNTLNDELNKNEYDILEFGYIKVPENERVNCTLDYSCLPKGILDNRYPHTVWNKCYSKKLVDRAIASFKPFYCNMTEDVFYSFVFSFFATKYGRIQDCLYCYRTGSGMSTSRFISIETLYKSFNSIEAKTSALVDFVKVNEEELLSVASKSKEHDYEYLADIVVACSKMSLIKKRKLLMIIDEQAGSEYLKLYKTNLSFLGRILKKIKSNN